MNIKQIAAAAVTATALFALPAVAPSHAGQPGMAIGGTVSSSHCIVGNEFTCGPGRIRRHHHNNFDFDFYFNYPGYPVYPRYYPYYNEPPYYYADKMTCRQARRMLLRRGFHDVEAVDCAGQFYVFVAFKRGLEYRARVNAFSGATRLRLVD